MLDASGDSVIKAAGGSLKSANRIWLADTASLELGGNNTSDGVKGTANTAVKLGAHTLTIDIDSIHTFDGVISGTGGLIKAGNNTQVLGGANTYTGNTQVTAGTLILRGSVASNTISVGANSTLALESGTYANQITGAGNLTKLTTGTVTLTGNNSALTGTVGVGNGVLEVQGSMEKASFNIGQINTVSEVRLSANTVSKDSNLSLFGNSKVTLLGDQTVGEVRMSGSDSSFNLGTHTLTLDSNTIYAAEGGFTGTGSLVKNGTGTVELKGNNTFTGTTTVNSGTLSLTGGTLASNDITVKGSSILSTSGDFISDQAFVKLEDTGTFNVLGNETIGRLKTAAGTEVKLNNFTLTFGDNNNETLAGGISGTGGLTKAGTGRVTLSSDSTFTGDTNVTNGQLELAGSVDSSKIGISSTGDLKLVNADSLLDSSSVTLSDSGELTVTADETIGLLAGTGNTKVSLVGGNLSIGNLGGITEFAGSITGTGGLTKAGGHTLTLSGSNSFTGPLNVLGGELVLKNSLAANAVNVSGSSLLNLDGVNITDTAAFTLSDTAHVNVKRDDTVGKLSGSSGTEISLKNANFGFGDSTNSQFDGRFSGAGDLIKNGSGEFTLAGDSNGITGTLRVTDGTLKLAGSINATGISASNDAIINITSNNGLQGQQDVSLSGTSKLFFGNHTSVKSINTTAGTTVNAGAYRLGVDGTGFSDIRGTLIGTGDLQQTGTGALVISGDGSGMTGNVLVGQGSLTLTRNGRLGSSLYQVFDGKLAADGGAFLNSSVIDLRGASELTISGNETISQLKINHANTKAAVNSGIFTVSGNVENFGTFTVGNGATLSVGGNLFNGGTVQNSGTVNDDLHNGGTVVNSGIWNAVVADNDGTITNKSGATWTGNVQKNVDTIINESGANWVGDLVQNAGTTTNAGNWQGNATINGGQLVTTGTFQANSVTLNNSAILTSGQNGLGDTTKVTLNDNAIYNVTGDDMIGNFSGTANTKIKLQNAGLTFGDASNSQLTGEITGTGSLTKKGSGEFTQLGALTQDASGTIDLVIDGGRFVSTGMLKAGKITLNNNAYFLRNSLNGFELSSGLALNDSATLELLSSTTFTSLNAGAGTTINANDSSLFISNPLNQQMNSTFAGTLIGTRALAVSNNNMLFTGQASNFTGSVSYSGNRFELSGNGTLGASWYILRTGNFITDGGGLFNPAQIDIFDGQFTTTGAETVSGIQLLESASKLDVKSDTLTVTGNVDNKGTVTVDSGATLTINGNLTNSGTVQNNGTLNDDLINTGTVINSGVWNAVVASNEGTITNNSGATWTGNVLDNKGVIVNDSGATWVGDITQTGGSITNSGIWQGNLTLAGGTVQTLGTGSWTGLFTAKDTTLKGSASFRNLQLNNSVLDLNDNAVDGVVTVNGDLSLDASSTVKLDVDSKGKSDRIDVTGNVTLNGTLAATALGQESEFDSIEQPIDYTIISNDGADAITGSFSEVTNNLAFIRSTVLTDGGDGNDAVLRFELKSKVPDFTQVVTDESSQDVAEVMNSFDYSSDNGQELLDALNNLTTEEANEALDQIGGDDLGASQGSSNSAGSGFGGTVVSVAGGGSSSGSSGGTSETAFFAATPDPNERVQHAFSAALNEGYIESTTVWFRGFADYSEIEGDGNAPGVSAVTGGIAAGMHFYPFDDRPEIMLGFTGGFSKSFIDVANSNSSSEAENYHGGIYTTFGSTGSGSEGFGFTGLAQLTHIENSSERHINFGGLNRVAEAKFDSLAFGIQGHARYGMETEINGEKLIFAPTVGLTYNNVRTDSFTETGAGVLNITSAASANDSLSSSLGFQLSKKVPLGEETATVTLSSAWLHEYLETQQNNLFTLSGSQTSFTSLSPEQSRDSVLVQGGLSFSVTDMMTAELDGYTRFSGTSQQYGGSVVLNRSF